MLVIRLLATVLLALSIASPAAALNDPRPTTSLITDEVVQTVRDYVASPVVWKSVVAQNDRYGLTPQSGVEKLNEQWVAETESDDQPLIASVLTSPLSSYLIRIQAGSLGLYTEIFITDSNGLNVGQSAVTSDYWQGDEAKFQKTFPVGPDALFIDEAEWDDERGIWRAQINMTVAHPESGEAIGHATFEVNLTELQRRRALSLSM